MSTTTYNTLNHLIQLNDRNLADLNVTDLLEDAPLLNVLHAQPASQNTLHKYLKQTRASSAGFRDANTGVVKTASQDTLVSVTLKIIDASFDTDVALANGYKGGRDAWLQMELIRSLKQSMFKLERQSIHGTIQNNASAYLGDQNGFAGLANSTVLDHKNDAMVVEAETAGTTQDGQTSVWLIRHGRDDVSAVVGDDGRFVFEEEPTIIQKTVDQDTLDAGSFYPAFYVPVTGWAALQLGGVYSAARICNIETKLTDDDIYRALALFPSGRQPNAIVMNRKALMLLRQSRTAVNPTGAPAPRPTEVDGIPIVTTDAVQSTEKILIDS